MNQKTDEQLIAQYLNGSEESLQELFSRYLRPIYNFTYRYVKSSGDAEDLTQDIFLNVWKNIHKFEADKKFSTWIFTFAKNASLNWIKKKKPLLFTEFENADGENPLLDSLQDNSPQPDELFAQAEIRVNMASAVKTLNPQYQSVLKMHYDKQLTFREISENTGEPLHTVKSRHRRALIALKKIIRL